MHDHEICIPILEQLSSLWPWLPSCGMRCDKCERMMGSMMGSGDCCYCRILQGRPVLYIETVHRGLTYKQKSYSSGETCVSFALHTLRMWTHYGESKTTAQKNAVSVVILATLIGFSTGANIGVQNL